MKGDPTLDLLEPLVARLCHDLAGPIGAVSNGLELLAEAPGDAETLALVRRSVDAASGRLAFLRAVFGSGGKIEGSETARGLLVTFLAARGGGALAVEWSVPASTSAEHLRLALLFALVAAEHLPRGGTLVIGAESGRASVRGVGRTRAEDPAMQRALLGPHPDLAPREAALAMASHLAAQLGLRMTLALGPEDVVLALRPA